MAPVSAGFGQPRFGKKPPQIEGVRELHANRTSTAPGSTPPYQELRRQPVAAGGNRFGLFRGLQVPTMLIAGSCTTGLHKGSIRSGALVTRQLAGSFAPDVRNGGSGSGLLVGRRQSYVGEAGNYRFS
jgi:hypothetical protein